MKNRIYYRGVEGETTLDMLKYHEDVQSKLQDLEKSLRNTAFALLEHQGAYGQAQAVLKIAEGLQAIEAQFASVMDEADASKPTRRSAVGWGAPNYPYFCIKNNRLVRVGKGKDSERVYRQEVERGAFDVLAGWIVKQGSTTWGVNDMAREHRDDIPQYKVYAVVGALEEADLIRRVGRGRYSTTPLAGDADAWWTKLERGPVVEDDEPSSYVPEAEPFGDDIPF